MYSGCGGREITARSENQGPNEFHIRDDYNILVSIRETIPKYQVFSRKKVRILFYINLFLDRKYNSYSYNNNKVK